MARWLDEATKFVFSRTREQLTWRNSRVLRELEPREIDAMKREPGEDIMVFGSGSIVSQLTQHSLIDEYRLIVSPILLGDGRTLLNGVSKSQRLDLLEATKYPSGNVMLRDSRSS
jgi:dihydrofolate reductase